jgi:hypothetical protein
VRKNKTKSQNHFLTKSGGRVMKKIMFVVLALAVLFSLAACKKEVAQEVAQIETTDDMNLVVQEFEDLVMDIEREVKFSGTISVELVDNNNPRVVLIVNQINHYYSYSDDVWVPDTVQVIYFNNTPDCDGITKFSGKTEKVEGEFKHWNSVSSVINMRMVKFSIVPFENIGYIVSAEYWPCNDARWRRDKKGYTPENIMILKRYI